MKGASLRDTNGVLKAKLKYEYALRLIHDGLEGNWSTENNNLFNITDDQKIVVGEFIEVFLFKGDYLIFK